MWTPWLWQRCPGHVRNSLQRCRRGEDSRWAKSGPGRRKHTCTHCPGRLGLLGPQPRAGVNRGQMGQCDCDERLCFALISLS